MTPSNLSVFDFEDHHVRFVGTPENPEWVAADIGKVLGLANIRVNLASMEGYQKGVSIVYTSTGNKEVATVKEAGLYALIFSSRKKVAKRFQRWVFEEVLPSIRKNGYYISLTEKQRQEAARIKGKYARRTLTDAIKAYIDRHPELSDKGKRWTYKNATDELYRQVYGKQAKKLVEAIGCDRRHLRDALSVEELCAIDAVELTAMKLIDIDVPPKDAMLQAAGRVMVVGAFRDRHSLVGAM